MDDTPLGTLLAGKYEIRQLVGRGGMGAVYEGLHVEIGKRVAIKLLDSEHARSEEVEGRFRLEGRAASKIDSDHVVEVFDVGRDPVHGLYMVMEFLVGEDLAMRLEREGVLELSVALDIAQQVARGLAKAHAASVIHRDLKPGNVFLSERDDGTLVVKIVDFGISKLLTDEASKAGVVTRYGSAVGTPQYMSPEQAQGLTIDARSDVWALGAVLYEMLSGRPAYPLLENYEQTIFSIVLKRPTSLREVAPWVPESVSALVNQAMEPDLALRIADAATFAKLLVERGRNIEVTAQGGAAPLPLVREPDKAGDPADSAPKSNRGAGTVSGVEVQTGHHTALDSEFFDEPEPEPRPPPMRAILGAAFVAVLAIGGAALWMRHNATMAPKQPAAAAPQQTVVTPAPSPEPPVASVTAAPSASVSVSAPAPSVSATKATAPVVKATASSDQFGGTGLSNSY